MACGTLQISCRGLEVDGWRRGGKIQQGITHVKYAHKCVSPDTSCLMFPESAEPCGIVPEDAGFPWALWSTASGSVA